MSVAQGSRPKAQGKQQDRFSSVLPYALRPAPYASCIRRRWKPAENAAHRKKSHLWKEITQRPRT
jgi:hypothetical protein